MKKTFLIMIVLSLIGCGRIRNLMFPKNNDFSIIGISIRTATPFALKYIPEAVYFFKLDEKDEYNLGKIIIPSNYVKGDYAYLINARPGTYAAIGSMFTHNDNGYYTFYDAAIIEKTLIEAGPNQIVFAGRFNIESKMKTEYRNIEQNGDRAQLHYYNLLKKT